jgi:hypothetical protein
MDDKKSQIDEILCRYGIDQFLNFKIWYNKFKGNTLDLNKPELLLKRCS